ncbi:hypothetical protein [Colwellia sp. 12G3]|uniref:hypothetical protein n=1 Tax=Colwellia sp. 12G3 TaxID=2058299 RepID=UPI000C3484ED|nr:hypothetical protein [Colwellia sp. 12G3]PKI13906.1 hypothetical protein CXF71_15050 [Colwellia sp. 12G3]
MTKLLTTAKNYYWASIFISFGVVFNLIKENFLNVGILLILSALLIAIGFSISRKKPDKN